MRSARFSDLHIVRRARDVGGHGALKRDHAKIRSTLDLLAFTRSSFHFAAAATSASISPSDAALFNGAKEEEEEGQKQQDIKLRQWRNRKTDIPSLKRDHSGFSAAAASSSFIIYSRVCSFRQQELWRDYDQTRIENHSDVQCKPVFCTLRQQLYGIETRVSTWCSTTHSAAAASFES